MSDSTDIQTIKNRCYSVIDRFAHRDILRDDDIRAWVAAVVESHGEAAVWHATRAGGFGGSDIGILVRNFSGHRADHMSSAHDIVSSKLLKSTPDEDAGDLRRGHDNEPAHALRYYDKYHAQRDEKAFNTLSGAQGLRVWMRYSPDDVVLLPSNRPNPALGGMMAKRLLIDYKAPRQVEENDSIAFQYSCQLHQGAMVCAKAGVHLDGLMLSQFDWAHWELKDDSIAYDAELSRLILQAGDYYHEFVMRGEVPPYIMTPRFDREAEFLESIGYQAQRLAHLTAANKAFEDEVKFTGAQIKAALGDDVRLAGKKMQLGDLAISAISMVDHQKVAKLLTRAEIAPLRKKGVQPEYDLESMSAKLRELGGNPEDFRVDKVDAEKAYAYLLKQGHDPEQFMTEQVRFKVSDHLKEAAIELVHASFPRMPSMIELPTQAEPASQQAIALALVEQLGHADSGASETILEIGAPQAQRDVREGQFTERHSQRTAMV